MNFTLMSWTAIHQAELLHHWKYILEQGLQLQFKREHKGCNATKEYFKIKREKVNYGSNF